LDDDRLGCGSLILAAILVVIERVVLFNELGQSTSSVALHVHSFLFGHPPYSIFDTLLGFQIPDDGIVFFLQPRNLLVAIIQAVHLGINFAIVSALFWILAEVHRITKKSQLIRLATLTVVLLALVSMVVHGFKYFSQNPVTSRSAIHGNELAFFSKLELGIQFNYPSLFTITTERDATRGIVGELLILQRISGMSTSSLVGFVIDVVEEPVTETSTIRIDSPLSDDALRAMVTSELAHLNYPSTNSNIETLIEASENAQITTLAGHHAATYTASFEETEFGSVYVRGAMIITPRRNISVIVFGGDESDTEGSVTPEEISDTWDKITSSLQIEY
jgi:hypothetical protein